MTLLFDYPPSQGALARLRQDHDGEWVAARFELYWGALELANGYHELADAKEQAARFAVPVDRRLLAALAHGLPDCAGVALGLERLLMALMGAERIDAVLTFPWERA